jgi:hypothetical protein
LKRHGLFKSGAFLAMARGKASAKHGFTDARVLMASATGSMCSLQISPAVADPVARSADR